MHSNLSIGVVIPCCNEEEGVRGVIGRLPAVVDEVVVVDNNCTDRTAEVAASLGVRVVSERTPGHGAAYEAGLRAVQSDIVVTLDGDGTYPPEEILHEVLGPLDPGPGKLHDLCWRAARVPALAGRTSSMAADGVDRDIPAGQCAVLQRPALPYGN